MKKYRIALLTSLALVTLASCASRDASSSYSDQYFNVTKNLFTSDAEASESVAQNTFEAPIEGFTISKDATDEEILRFVGENYDRWFWVNPELWSGFFFQVDQTAEALYFDSDDYQLSQSPWYPADDDRVHSREDVRRFALSIFSSKRSMDELNEEDIDYCLEAYRDYNGQLYICMRGGIGGPGDGSFGPKFVTHLSDDIIVVTGMYLPFESDTMHSRDLIFDLENGVWKYRYGGLIDGFNLAGNASDLELMHFVEENYHNLEDSILLLGYGAFLNYSSEEYGYVGDTDDPMNIWYQVNEYGVNTMEDVRKYLLARFSSKLPGLEEYLGYYGMYDGYLYAHVWTRGHLSPDMNFYAESVEHINADCVAVHGTAYYSESYQTTVILDREDGVWKLREIQHDN